MSADPRAFADSIADAVADALGDDLVGVYLYGSAAVGGFNPARSDVDLIVVTRGPMDEAQTRSLARLFLDRSGRPYALEATVLTEANLRPWRHPLPFDFHFGEGWRERMEAALGRRPFKLAFSRTNPDLAAEIAALRERGLCLRGARIAEVFPEVPIRDVLDSISRDLRWAKENRRDVYGVLNACRALVARALDVYESRSDAIDDDTQVWAFVDGVRSRVDAAL